LASKVDGSVAGRLDFPLKGLSALSESRKVEMLGPADGAGAADWVEEGAGADLSLGAGAGVGNGMVCAATTAAPASHPDTKTAIHAAWRIAAMSFSAFGSALRCPPARLVR
jgi:hypothetical protein